MRYYDCFPTQQDGKIRYNLILELCEGGTLTDKIRKGIPQLDALQYFGEIILGMSYMNVNSKHGPIQIKHIEI